VYNDRADYALAEPLLIQARDGYKNLPGENKTRYHACLMELANTYAGKRDIVQAEKCLTPALEFFKRTSGEGSLRYLNGLSQLAQFHSVAGDHGRALQVRTTALETAIKALGDNHPTSVSLRKNLAVEYQRAGEFAKAVAVFREALAGLKPEEQASPRRADFLFDLSLPLSEMGRHAESDRLISEAEAILKKTYGPRHPAYLRAFAGMAYRRMEQGDYARAEPMMKEVLEANEATFGPTHPRCVLPLRALAQLYRMIGDRQRCEPFYRKALAIQHKHFGAANGETLELTLELGTLCVTLGRKAEGEKLMNEALAGARSFFGPTHSRYLHFLTESALECSQSGDLERAKDLYRKALPIAKTKHGEESSTYAFLLHRLGMSHVRQGEYAEAEPLLTRAAKLLNKTGHKHMHQVEVLDDRAWFHQATGRHREAMELQRQVLAEEQRDLHSIFGFTAESSINASLRAVADNGSLDRYFTMTLSNGPPDAEAVKVALSWGLRRKGMALDTLCRFRAAQRLLAENPALQEKASRWRTLRQQIANSALNRRGLDPDALKQQVAAWTEEADRLEAELNRAAAGRIDHPDADAEKVQAQLPPGSVLIEVFRASVFDFTAKGKAKRFKPRRYYAFVLPADKTAKVSLIDLGPAAPIDAAIRKLRDEIQKAPRQLSVSSEKDLEAEFARVSRESHRRIFAPIQKQLGKETLLFIAPDGELNRLPFEALVDEQGKYLVERYRIAYLASGRDLLRPAAAAPAQGTVVFAGPDYDLKSKDRQAQAEKLKTKVADDAVALRGQTPELRGMRWKPLRGAAAEARDVTLALHEGKYGPVRAYRGPEAIEEALKGMKAPRILHLATHGFFLPDDQKKEEDDEAPEVGAAAGMARLRRFSNPLLRSGVVLAGANALGEEGATGEDGWVTAEEISLLDLRGTELVVLSACESGLGDVKVGEGVFGLRRAFLYAGARTLLISLFEVPDAQTRDMMRSFYDGMKAGKGKTESLHAAQLEMIRRRRQDHQAAHPFFWASFVLVGDPK
jgi:CHAT domain-containing protein/Tfp pilus assembly protein PilF